MTGFALKRRHNSSCQCRGGGNTLSHMHILTAVAEANQTVVAGVRSQIIHVHDEGARRRHARAHAAERLQTQAAVGAVLLAAHAALEAAALDIVLAALVVLHLAVENAVSKY